MEGTDISKRAEVIRNWEDFLNKYMGICNADEYDEVKNPNGYINLGTAVNNMCRDIIVPRLTSPHVWECNLDLLQYREGYGILKLRKALATVMTEFLCTHEPVDPEDLICVVGVTACLDILAHCLADPGEVILAPTPIYGRIYTDFMQRAEVKLWPIPIISKENDELSPILNIEKVKKAYEDAISQKQVVKALILLNPSNPLGDIYSSELLMDIFTFCNEHDLHVIMDEVYALSIFNGSPEFHSALKFPTLPNKNKLHVLYGISKDFGIAGLRIGAIHTRCKPLKNCLRQLSFFHDIPFPVMDIAAKFLEDLDWLKKYLSINRQRITDKFKESLDYCRRMGLNVRASAGGFFLWLDFRPICGSSSFEQERDFFLYLIEKAHLYIVPGEELFCAQPGWFRLTFTANPDHVNAGLKRLEEAIKNYSKKV
ncbi:1-aminocyclopropane-1-carboxylate synthase-like protein 1 isoform X2 [Argiope bruennichi]|uniref:1-aminocyclopropane-1-carboxylate like protein n=1 Tax=Argiope bruennichi TaxID=94029 RepID=A0A8T0E2P9_ARGBR|nr:1-aminocyclopropane-1-carboxylate synthase-like protein 1 isoform X2 [Argiope bruennichi]KAF8764171.1 1-aminocyclopropane-1-carboxylate like protein [Argiope bruennichi]